MLLSLLDSVPRLSSHSGFANIGPIPNFTTRRVYLLVFYGVLVFPPASSSSTLFPYSTSATVFLFFLRLLRVIANTRPAPQTLNSLGLWDGSCVSLSDFGYLIFGLFLDSQSFSASSACSLCSSIPSTYLCLLLSDEAVIPHPASSLSFLLPCFLFTPFYFLFHPSLLSESSFFFFNLFLNLLFVSFLSPF